MSENGTGRRGHTSTAQDQLLQGLRELGRSGKYADLTSDFFAKACDGAFMEAGSNTVDLVDDDPEAVAAMIQYFYHSDYNAGEYAPTNTAPLVLHIRIYALADKYFIKPLRSLAWSKFKSRLRREWRTPAFAEAAREVYSTSGAQQAKFLRHIERTLVQHPELVYEHEKYHDFCLVLRENGTAAVRVAMLLAHELDWLRGESEKGPA